MSRTFDFISRLISSRMELLEKQIAALQSQPRLQRVTPEAMAELKDQETPFILFRHKEEPAFRFERVEYSKFSSLWLDVDGYEINPFDWQWFIVPSAIPEVQQ